MNLESTVVVSNGYSSFAGRKGVIKEIDHLRKRYKVLFKDAPYAIWFWDHELSIAPEETAR